MSFRDASRKTGGGSVKQAQDHFTRDLLDKPKRGRPPKPDAKTPAQRAREYRAREKAKGPKGRPDPYRMHILMCRASAAGIDMGEAAKFIQALWPRR